MIDQFRTVYRGGTGEIVEKKSRFIATVRLVESEEEALSCLEALRKKYWDARHNCFVYIIGENQETVRCSDDGEPSGTAGRPMLDVVQGAGLRNVLVVVTRYFGGTLLGTGGLVRAYSQAVQEGPDFSQHRADFQSKFFPQDPTFHPFFSVIPCCKYSIDFCFRH